MVAPVLQWWQTSRSVTNRVQSEQSVANGGLSSLFLERGFQPSKARADPGREHTMKSAKLLSLAIIAILPLVLSAAWGKHGNPAASNQDSRKISGQRNRVFGQTSKDSGTSVEQQIKTLHEQRRNAALQGDAGFFEQYLADDYLGSRDDGRLITKEQEVRMVRSGAIKYEAINERDVKVRVYGETAIVSAVASVKLSVNGKSITGDQRAIFVWVKQEGSWKLASFQATRVAPMFPRPGNNLGHDARPAPP